MSKRFLRTLCAILCIVLCLPIFTSCVVDTMYELGPYSLDEEEYAYLMCTHKRQILESLGLNEAYIDYPIAEDQSTTYGEYIEKVYREQFEQSVYSLIYAQALFDEYKLELSEDEKNSINAIAGAIVYTYGEGSAERFNSLASEYGFSQDTLYSIYEKQAKESKVINYLLGENYSKITDKQKEEYYKENYIHFQTLVVNCLYQKNENGTFSNISEAERQTKLKLVEELTAFLCREDMTYNYVLLPKILKVDDMSSVTYEDIWNNPYINDDTAYVGGVYMPKPNIYQMASKNTLSQAMHTQEGDVSAIEAKRYFDGDGKITLGDSSETINKGDYFEYGTAFIKRLPMEEGAWKKEENKDFFSSNNFVGGAAKSALLAIFSEYEKLSPYTLVVNLELKEEFSLITIPANRIDYDYFNQKEEEKK